MMNPARSRVGVREVARLAGVSPSTVSNVLNSPESVRPSTRARVDEAIIQLGFVRNESARQLRTGESRSIGLIIPEISNPFFTEVARGAENYLWSKGLSLVLCNSDYDTDREKAYIDLLMQMRVRGLIVTPLAGVTPTLAVAHAAGVPVVLFDHQDDTTDLPTVSFRDIEGGALAIEHLLAHGATSVGYVGFTPGTITLSDRLRGARLAWSGAGLNPDDLHLLNATGLNPADARPAAQAFLQMGAHRPHAVLCANDLLASGFLQEMLRNGVRVPEDVAICGYDDTQLLTESAAIPLTSIRKPAYDMGWAAAKLVVQEHASQTSGTVTASRSSVFEPHLIVRESTGYTTAG